LRQISDRPGICILVRFKPKNGVSEFTQFPTVKAEINAGIDCSSFRINETGEMVDFVFTGPKILPVL